MINQDCNGLLEKAQKGDYSTGMPRQGQVCVTNFLKPSLAEDQFILSLLSDSLDDQLSGGHYGWWAPMPRVQPVEHLQGERIFKVQEQPHLDLPQLLRLLQAALLHPGEREELGGQRGRDGAQAHSLLFSQDGLSGMLLQSAILFLH